MRCDGGGVEVVAGESLQVRRADRCPRKYTHIVAGSGCRLACGAETTGEARRLEKIA